MIYAVYNIHMSFPFLSFSLFSSHGMKLVSVFWKIASFKKAANFPRSTNPWVVTLRGLYQLQLVQPKNRLVQQTKHKKQIPVPCSSNIFFPTESQLQQKTQQLCSSPQLSVISPFFSSSLLHSLPFVPYTFSKEVVWSALHSFCWNLLSGPHSTEGATTVNFPDGFLGEKSLMIC